MKSRAFTTRGELCHREWLSYYLQIPYTKNGGIDLLNDKSGIELKCRYSIYPHSWTVHHYEIDKFENDNPDKVLFWGFLLYNLKAIPSRIPADRLEEFVTEREVWFMEWSWIKQFPVATPKTGPYVYIYQKDLHHIQSEMQTKEIPKGIIHYPSGSLLEKLLPLKNSS